MSERKRKRYGQCLGVFFLFFEAKRPKKKIKIGPKTKSLLPHRFFPIVQRRWFLCDRCFFDERNFANLFRLLFFELYEERTSSRPARDGCSSVKARTDVLPVHFGVRCARLTASKGRFLGANAQRRDDANVALFWFVFWSRFFSSL